MNKKALIRNNGTFQILIEPVTWNGCSIQGRLENPSVIVKIIVAIGAYGLLILKQGSGL